MCIFALDFDVDVITSSSIEVGMIALIGPSPRLDLTAVVVLTSLQFGIVTTWRCERARRIRDDHAIKGGSQSGLSSSRPQNFTKECYLTGLGVLTP